MKPPIEMLLDGLTWVPVGTATNSNPESDLPYATHSGVLEFAGHKLRCYQLSNGMRVFDADDMNALMADWFGDDRASR